MADLITAVERLRSRALDHEAALGDGVTDIQPWDADWLRQQIAECRGTADLLLALADRESIADTDAPGTEWLRIAQRAHAATHALAAAIAGPADATPATDATETGADRG